jgi:dethiobiotin synthetase
MLNVFISGIDMQTGKTLVSAGLAATMQSLSYSTGVYKPIQTGASVYNGEKFSPDLAFVKNMDSNINTSVSFLISGKSTPLVSAYSDKVAIDTKEIIDKFQMLSNINECNIVEGCNSISTLINDSLTEADIIKDLRLPLVLVVNPTKSTIDNVVTTLNYINTKKINLLGIIINQYNENSESLEQRYFPQIVKDIVGGKLLGTLPDYVDIKTLPAEMLIADILTRINLEEIFRVKIAKLNT